MDNTTLKKIILSNFTMKKMTLPMWYQEKIMFNILWFVSNYSCLIYRVLKNHVLQPSLT
jgi:hypothetical protein